jgi:outer membrane protein OmpA-like peptidoglycan-associated protein
MATNHEGSGLASSMTDLMTSLAVIFILLLVGMLNNAQQEAKGIKSQVLTRLQNALKEFEKNGVQVTPDPNDPLGLLVLVPEDLLNFAQDKSLIPQKGREFLRNFIPKLVSTACSSDLRQGISSIVVEGHTSSEGTDARNLELSQERSLAVVQKSLTILDKNQKPGAAPSGLHGCFLNFVSATGRGSTEPVKTASGQEDRGRSRRVVFKIRVQSLEQRQLERQVTLTSQAKAEGGQ